jgi:hypothetical protein
MIISIAPRLPPSVCGVGTYSLRLTQAWPCSEVFVHLVVDGAETSRQILPQSNIVSVGYSSARLFRELCSRQPRVVILHYSSRGYHRYGIPLWLPRAIQQWRKNGGSAILVLMLHEVPYPLPLSSHHGLIYRINHSIIKNLCLHASIVVTNTIEHSQRLSRDYNQPNVPVIPVPSNIPYPRHHALPCQLRREADFLIFGLPFSQLGTIKSFANELKYWSSRGLLQYIHLVGPSSREVSRLLSSLVGHQAIVCHGVLSDPDLSFLLSRVGFCLTQATELNYTKSGTLMAFASHGCPTIAKISASSNPFNCFVQPSEIGHLTYHEFIQRAEELRSWYLRESDWPLVSEKFSSLINSCCS